MQRIAQTYDFADPSQASSGSLHHHLPLPLAEGVSKVRLEVSREDIVEVWLAAELVYPLGDLVARCVAETGEEGEHFAAERCGGVFSEDDARHGGHRELQTSRRSML